MQTETDTAKAFPIDAIRSCFPSLSVTDDGAARTYLDNPAGTQVPKRVADAAAHTLIYANANLGGAFVTSLAAEAVVQRAHEAMATFLGASSYREVAIAQSMTNHTFALSRSIGRTLQRGDEIVVTRMDHDGNVGPWLMLAEDLGLTVRWVEFNEHSWRIEPDALSAQLSSRTRLVALNYASNLTGSINDVTTLTKRAKQAGALVYVDAVQFAPHGTIDVEAIGCDFLACSSYKFFGPHLGIVWGRESLLEELEAYKVRPATTELPWKFETGTPQIELQAALTATVEYVAWLGRQCGAVGDERAQVAGAFGASIPWERELAARLIDGLKRIGDVTIYGITEPADFGARVPTVSFRHARIAPDVIARALAKENVFVWSGHNYALEIVRQLGIPEDEGVVRIGAAHYNTLEEIDRTLEIIARLK
jgi:cysteine desulfurase family protein (TIGR01976 family)